jgi:hypothetical protein
VRGAALKSKKRKRAVDDKNYKICDRLIKDLELINFPERVKSQQKDWMVNHTAT